MNSPPDNERPKGFLLMCGCMILLAQYWLFVGPLWKYGSYTFLGVVGVCGLLVALTARRGYRSLGWLVLTASIVLGYETFDSRKHHNAMMDRRYKAAESRLIEELKKEAPPVSKEGTR